MRVVRMLAVCMLAVCMLAACTRVAPDATPEGAVRLWLEKMEASTSDPRATREAYELLGPVARANLAQRAERAAKVQGRRVEPFEMLAEGRFGLKFRPKTMNTRIDGDGAHATVEVIGDAPLLEHAVVRCARAAEPSPGSDPTVAAPSSKDGAWRVEPELPDVVTLPKRADGAPSP